MSLKFVSLHNHSGFSLYDGIGSTEDIANWVIKNAGEEGMAFAQTDHGSCSGAGAIAAAQKKLKDKIRIFYGTESYYLPSLKDWATLKRQREEEKKEQKEEVSDDLVIENEAESKSKYFDPINRRNHLVLVAQNQVGLKNLFRLVSKSYKSGFYRKPRIDFEMLKQHHEGLIASTACVHPDAIIRTSIGEITIKQLVERIKQKEEIYVMCFSETENRIVFERAIWGEQTRKQAKLIKIKLKNGKELKLTPDHKVCTDRGWLEVRNIKKTDKILGIPPI